MRKSRKYPIDAYKDLHGEVINNTNLATLKKQEGYKEANKVENPDKYSEHVDKVIADNEEEYGKINDGILKDLEEIGKLPTEQIYNELFNPQENGQRDVNARNPQQGNSGEQKPTGSSEGGVAKSQEVKGQEAG